MTASTIKLAVLVGVLSTLGYTLGGIVQYNKVTRDGSLPANEYNYIYQQEVVIKEEPRYIEMEVVASAYCIEPHHHICNDGNASVTATGTMPTAGRTIAVDPTIIPYGSQVEIDVHIYTAEDTGGAIKGDRIDIVFNTHQEALNFGIQEKTIKIYKEDK